MRTALFLPIFASLTISVIFKIRDLRANPGSPFLRTLTTSLALAATGALAGIPAVLTFLETRTGIPAIWILAPLMVCCTVLQATMLLWDSPPQEAYRRARPRVVSCGAATVAMIVLACESRGHITDAAIVANEQAPEALWATTPHLRDGFLVYFAVMIFTYAALLRRFFRSSRLVDRRWMRRALLTLSVGCVFCLSYSVGMAGYVIALRFGTDVPALFNTAMGSVLIGSSLCGIGVFMPALAPRWERMLAYRRLGPLWHAIRSAVPDVVLEPPWSTRMDAWSPRNLNFRFYRRVIEIRDGTLALRSYFDPEIPAIVRRYAATAGLSATPLDTTIEAAQLAVAIRSRIAGRHPRGESWRPTTPEGGDDLHTELKTLLPLAHAFATCPIVRSVESHVINATSPDQSSARPAGSTSRGS